MHAVLPLLVQAAFHTIMYMYMYMYMHVCLTKTYISILQVVDMIQGVGCPYLPPLHACYYLQVYNMTASFLVITQVYNIILYRNFLHH